MNSTSPLQTNIAPYLILPLVHRGVRRHCRWQIGDRVLKGQSLCYPEAGAPALLAPSSGHLVAIEQRPIADPHNTECECIVIKTDKLDKWHPDYPLFTSWRTLTVDEKIHCINDCAISGLGGAGFRTSEKLNSQQPIQLLIINAVECETEISCDAALIRHHSREAVAGSMELLSLSEASRCIIAIEDGKTGQRELIESAIKDWLEQAENQQLNLAQPVVISVPAAYPSGAETRLITLLTGQQLAAGQRPSDIGMLCFNVATAYSVQQLAKHSKAPLSRIVTIHSNDASGHSEDNYNVLFGTPIAELLAMPKPAVKEETTGTSSCGTKHLSKKTINIVGGNNSGFSFNSLESPITAHTNCVQVFDASTSPFTPGAESFTKSTFSGAAFTTLTKQTSPCIRCGECSTVCPENLLPQQLHWYLQADRLDEAVKFDLDSCLICGCCDPVCPSQIALTDTFRVARETLRRQRLEDANANLAKLRFDNRETRLLKRQLQREERIRLRKESVANKAATTAATPEQAADSQPDVATSKAKPQGNQPKDAPSTSAQAVATPKSNTTNSNKAIGKDAIAAALARAHQKKQKRLATGAATQTPDKRPLPPQAD